MPVLIGEPCGSRELIPPGTLAHIQPAAIVQPIIATKGKPWKGRLILVDHFQRKHKTQRIEFKWDGGPQAKVNLTKGRAQFKSEGGWRALDRKSTRLNSSHRCISYAVFC